MLLALSPSLWETWMGAEMFLPAVGFGSALRQTARVTLQPPVASLSRTHPVSSESTVEVRHPLPGRVHASVLPGSGPVFCRKQAEDVTSGPRAHDLYVFPFSSANGF